MWPFSTQPPPNTLDQDFITRYWDLSARVDALDAQLGERLDELERRYKRAEQSERRLDEKRAEKDWPDDEQPSGRRQTVYDVARKALNVAR